MVDLAYIRPEAIFVPVLCGKNAGRFTTGLEIAIIPAQFSINSHSFVSVK